MSEKPLDKEAPEELAVEFLRRAPASNRSQYVAAAIEAHSRTHDAELARASEAADQSAEVRDIENSFDAFADEADRVQEPW